MLLCTSISLNHGRRVDWVEESFFLIFFYFLLFFSQILFFKFLSIPNNKENFISFCFSFLFSFHFHFFFFPFVLFQTKHSLKERVWLECSWIQSSNEANLLQTLNRYYCMYLSITCHPSSSMLLLTLHLHDVHERNPEDGGRTLNFWVELERQIRQHPPNAVSGCQHHCFSS